MSDRSYRIVFMGTPEFAVPSLEALHKSGHRILRVVTQPDRPKGRGRKVIPPAVKKAASEMDLPVDQPRSIKPPAMTQQMAELSPDWFVVVAFGRILPPSLLSIPKYGTINVHASLLPKYRGPAPIQWAIIDREPFTGVTTMLMNEELDTGDILMSRRIPIRPDETAATLHDRLAEEGAFLLTDTLDAMDRRTITPVAQDHAKATYAPMLKKSDGRIDWRKSSEEIDAFVRGMTPWPGAFAFHKGKRFKFFKTQPVATSESAPPGAIIRSFPDELHIATGNGAVSVLEIQGESGKRLDIREFLKGMDMPPGTTFE